MYRKFCNKYRSESHRFPGWDYAGNGKYYLTLVTKERDCILGHIADGKMHLSGFGVIVNREWLKSFDIRKELFLDVYQIMPNHIHAIVAIRKNGNWHADTHGRAYLPKYPKSNKPFTRLPKSISSFIGGFKSGVNSKIDDYIDEEGLKIAKYNRNNQFFLSNYHDHVIRNLKEYQKIKNYIIQNPRNWNKDEFNNPDNDN